MRPPRSSIVITLPEAWCAIFPGGRGSGGASEFPIGEARNRSVSFGWQPAHAGAAPCARNGSRAASISKLVRVRRDRYTSASASRDAGIALLLYHAQVTTP